ncbi:MAG TPA: hypothetical protein PLY75_10145 [Gammaproteobacteria bacterium]|nr:hypothetical protein [Gammaproteobacteria bacterium]
MNQTMHGEKNIAPSNSASPDLDWSQVSETVRMLNLAVAQISMAMHEGEDSVESLTRSFTSMVGNVEDIAKTTASLAAGDVADDIKSAVLSRAAEVQGGIQQSIVAFQFYDRLSQRLDHVRFVLDALSALVADKSRLFNPAEWEGLQQSIRGRYSMQEEQDMFEALLNGASIEEALDLVRKRLHEGDINDIELF